MALDWKVRGCHALGRWLQRSPLSPANRPTHRPLRRFRSARRPRYQPTCRSTCLGSPPTPPMYIHYFIYSNKHKKVGTKTRLNNERFGWRGVKSGESEGEGNFYFSNAACFQCLYGAARFLTPKSVAPI